MTQEVLQWKSKGNSFSFKGFTIFYIKEGTGPVLTVFHGYPYNSFDFVKIWPALTKQFTVILPDMLGMGFSDKPQNHQYSFSEMADLYTALLTKLKITETHMLAHDLGNSVVQELLARQEEYKNTFAIKSVAFLNGGLFTDVYKPRFLQILLSRSPKPVGRIISRLLSKKSVSKATAEIFGDHTKPSAVLLQNFWDILNYNNGKAIAYLVGRLVFAKEKHQPRWIVAMQQTNTPMCFINGPADPISGVHMAVRYNQLIPVPNITLLDENIGHWPQIEAPEDVMSAYISFVQTLKNKKYRT